MRIRTQTATPSASADVELAGRFDAHAVEEFRTAVDGLVLQGHRDLWLDLGQVVFVDSSALAELVRLSRSLEDDGRLVLGPVSDPVRVILELTGLISVFSIEESSRVESSP